jgi:hypothetical protein
VRLLPNAATIRAIGATSSLSSLFNDTSERPPGSARDQITDFDAGDDRKNALVAFDAFVEIWGVKYDKAVECLTKDRDALPSTTPAEHWKHLRTTNPIESSFATVRHRTVRAKDALCSNTGERREAEWCGLYLLTGGLAISKLLLTQHLCNCKPFKNVVLTSLNKFLKGFVALAIGVFSYLSGDRH